MGKPLTLVIPDKGDVIRFLIPLGNACRKVAWVIAQTIYHPLIWVPLVVAWAAFPHTTFDPNLNPETLGGWQVLVLGLYFLIESVWLPLNIYVFSTIVYCCFGGPAIAALQVRNMFIDPRVVDERYVDES